MSKSTSNGDARAGRAKEARRSAAAPSAGRFAGTGASAGTSGGTNDGPPVQTSEPEATRPRLERGQANERRFSARRGAGFDEFLLALRDASIPAPALSPERFGEALGIGIQELAEQAHVHRNTIARAPGSPTVQAHLREAVRVIKAATDVYGSVDEALFWYRNDPLSEFDYRTPAEVVAAGRSSDLLTYVRMLDAGFLG